MKNDKRAKPFRVVLLDSHGTQEKEAREIHHAGPAGFSVKGMARTFWWGDEGKTWKRAEETR